MVTVDFTTAGADTWTAPADVTSVLVECLGGAGCGGGTTGINTQRPGGGSGAGASKTVAVTPGVEYDLFVGQGGAGVLGNTATNDGTGSWFDTPGTVFADFGTGSVTSTPGAGGQAANCVGDTVVDGNDGGAQGGGNGKGGDAPTIGTLIGGAGGAFPAGAGSPGNDGVQPGGGGSSAWSNALGPSQTSGSGADGQVRLTFTADPPPGGGGGGALTATTGGRKRFTTGRRRVVR